MIKKIYLSRAQTRAMAADHPVGDPTGGPAFGEKNDPISAVIAISTMGATYAAAGTFAAMTLMQGITFAGAALSLVGNITGNKTLMKIGAVAGIAGGIGMAAESAGLFKSGTVGETFRNSSVTGEMMTDPNYLGQTPTPVVDGKAVVPDASVVDVNAASNAIDGSYQARSLSAPNVNTAPANAVTSPAGGNPINTAPKLEALGPPMAPADYSLTYKGPAGIGAKLPNAATLVPKPGFAESLKAGNLMDAAGAVGSGAMDMLKNNPTGAYVAAQAIGGVADWLSGKTDSEIAALEANTGYADAKAQEVQLAIAKEKQRRLNMTNRYTSVSPQSGIAVNPNANAQAPGLVASNMQTRPA